MDLGKLGVELKKQHQAGLAVDEVIYLKLKDAVVCVYTDEEEKTLKVDVEMVPEDKTFVYFNNKLGLDDLF